MKTYAVEEINKKLKDVEEMGAYDLSYFASITARNIIRQLLDENAKLKEENAKLNKLKNSGF